MSRKKLTKAEISAAFTAKEMTEKFPPILKVEQVAALCQCSRSLIYRWSSEGKLDFAKTRHLRGRFWRDGIVAWLFGERGN